MQLSFHHLSLDFGIYLRLGCSYRPTHARQIFSAFTDLLLPILGGPSAESAKSPLSSPSSVPVGGGAGLPLPPGPLQGGEGGGEGETCDRAAGLRRL